MVLQNLLSETQNRSHLLTRTSPRATFAIRSGRLYKKSLSLFLVSVMTLTGAFYGFTRFPIHQNTYNTDRPDCL